MTRKITVKQVCLFLALSLCIITFCDLFLPGGEAGIYSSVIRLHVLAASDSQEDQRIKLAVRDAVLAAGIFEAAESMEEASQSIEAATAAAVGVANEVLEAEGAPYRASCLWGTERYPTREYEGLRLPAGDYLSLRIVLGEGRGQNWWCVLFPPLCVNSASIPPRTDDGLDPGAKKVFAPENKTKYVFRFKLLEVLFS